MFFGRTLGHYNREPALELKAIGVFLGLAPMQSLRKTSGLPSIRHASALSSTTADCEPSQGTRRVFVCGCFSEGCGEVQVRRKILSIS